MKAIQMHEFGGPEVLKIEEVPRPAPMADEVLIKVFASGVNPVDTKIRAGHVQQMFPVKLPLIPGWDFAGEIEQVGAAVKNFKPGDEVYGRPDLDKNGTYAEFVVVKANLIAPKPKSLGYEKAAGVPLAGVTAWQALFDHGNLQPGQKVLIHAASGGVGTFAVQFARWKGAYVIGTCSEENVDTVKKLGADKVIDYKKVKFEEKLKNLDLVIDLVGGDTQKRSIKVLKKGGTLVTTVAPEMQEEAKAKNIKLVGFMAKSTPADLEQIAQLIDSGKVQPVISKILPLEQAAEAHRLVEDGHTPGKVILKVV
ncbi:MAG: NADP-dependent oxidoreductase [Bacteroidota bacterium]|nr:NADP-dependent oxidoreductase [Bacteroidota bacterium]